MKSNTVEEKQLMGLLGDSRIERFLRFLEEIREQNSKYQAIIVVLDNFSTHRSRKVKERAQEMGIYLVYLPPYSPDLNPIEFIWKVVKRVISVSFIKHVDELKGGYTIFS